MAKEPIYKDLWMGLLVCTGFQAASFTLIMEAYNNLLWHVHKAEMYLGFSVGSLGFLFFGYVAWHILSLLKDKKKIMGAG